MRILSALTTLTLALSSLVLAQDPVPAEWRKARNTQDRAALERISGGTQAAANKSGNDANSQYRAALS